MTPVAQLPVAEPIAETDQLAGSPVILTVDDEPNIRRLLAYKLERAGYEVLAVESGEKALEQLATVVPDLVMLDLKLPGMQGLDVLDAIRERHRTLPVVVLTAQGSVETAVEAMKRGAQDFITKPFEIERLEIAVSNALRLGRLEQTVEILQLQLGNLSRTETEVIGRDGGLRQTFSLIEKVVPTDLTVLLEGESGTGKEILARAIHDQGPRRRGPFAAINCAALPEPLLEGELFGWERGAFTGADRERAGRFEDARGGTLLLDEVGEMSAPLQAKLLRVLQENTVTRLGCSRSIPIDVRIICATNRDLLRDVRAGRFREDLYYRVAVFPITVPPLRDRRGDIPALCEHVLSKARPDDPPSLHPRALEMLEAYDWPGNVRELQNVLRRATVIAGRSSILPEHLTTTVQAAFAAEMSSRGLGAMTSGDSSVARGPAPPVEPRAAMSLADVERRHILDVLEACEGNLSRASRLLGIGRTTLYRKLERYGFGAPSS